MQLAQPVWIIIGLIISPALFLLFRFFERRRQSALARFAASHLLGQLTRHLSRQRRQAKQLLLIIAIFLCFAALARPQMGFTWVEIQNRGVDILFALDTSKSMLAADIKPNRFERARYGIIDFVKKIGGDRVGLLSFAGSAFLSCPLTLDYSAFEQTLQATDTDTIPTPGTDLAAVIREAEKVFSTSGHHKILVLLTDGENLQGEAIAAAEEAAASGLTIHTIGVGTADGELVPAGDNGQGFIRDARGAYVTSRLDDTMLRRIARTTGGLYVPLGNRGEGLETVYQQRLALLPKEKVGERRQKLPVERYSWPLMLAMALLVAESLLPERKGSGRLFFGQRTWNFKNSGKMKIWLILLPCLVLCCSSRESAAGEGERYYHAGEYRKAAEFYRRELDKSPDDPILNFNNGAIAYRNNLFDEAIDAFTRSLMTDDLELQRRSYHNRGNAFYRKGIETLQTDPRKTIEQWQQALESYEASLRLRDAPQIRHNRDMVAQKLHELQQQEKKREEQERGGSPKMKDKDQPGNPDQPQRPNDPVGQPADSAGKRNQPEPSSPESHDGGHEALRAEERQQDTGKSMQEKQPRLPGRMTPGEAQQLLEGMQTEERLLLNSAPANTGSRSDQPERNW